MHTYLCMFIYTHYIYIYTHICAVYAYILHTCADSLAGALKVMIVDYTHSSLNLGIHVGRRRIFVPPFSPLAVLCA